MKNLYMQCLVAVWHMLHVEPLEASCILSDHHEYILLNANLLQVATPDPAHSD